jgi:phospholipid transport system substrate-binding protein
MAMRLFRLLPIFGLVLVLGFIAPARAADDPGSFIDEAGNSVLRLAREQNLSQAEFKQRLRTIALRDFDVPRIAQFVLGRYWRTLNPGDRQQFVEAFENYMVQVYATRFRQYGGAQFKVTGQQVQGNNAMVMTEIAQSSGQPPAKVIWQVTKGPDGYKITDVEIEGISQAVTYRQEFSSVIAQNNGQVSALTAQLRQKASG